LASSLIDFAVNAARKAFARGVFDLSASMILVMALGFAQNFVLARLLGAQGLGHMAVIYSVTNVAGLLATIGLTSSILRYGAAERTEGGAWGVYQTGLRMVAGTSIVSGLLIAAFSQSPLWVFDPVAGAWMPIVVAVVPAQALATCTWHYLQSRSRMRDKALLELLGRLCIVAAVVVGALADGFRGCAIGYVVGNLVSGALSLGRTRMMRPAERAAATATPRELVRFGVWGLVTNALSMVLITTDVLTMSALVGDPKAVGAYSLASLFQQVVSIPMRAYLDARFPEMTKASEDLAGLRRLRRRMRLHLLAITIAPAAALAAVAPFVIPRVFGADFEASLAPLSILLLGQIFYSTGAAQGRSMFAAGWVQGNFWASGVAAAYNVAANLFLVPRLGAVGAAIATASTHLLWSIAVSAMCRWHESERRR
jgi:O-antigen/teichoic acid export membrane protein